METEPYLKLKKGDTYIDAYQHIPGKGYVKFFVNDGYVPAHFILETENSKRYSAYLLIHKDLNFVSKAIDTLKNMSDDNANDILRQALSTSIAVTYGKCFTEANHGRGTTLNKNFFSKGDPDIVRMHDEIMKARHDYYAHSGKTQLENNPIVLAVAPDFFRVHSNTIYMLSFKFNFDKLEALISYVLEYVANQISIFFDKMMYEVRDKGSQTFMTYPVWPDSAKLVTMNELNSKK